MREFPRYFTDSATLNDVAPVSEAACYSKERNKTYFLSAGYEEGAAPYRRGNDGVLLQSDGIDLFTPCIYIHIDLIVSIS